MARAAARAAASTLSSVSCETLVNLWARLVDAKSKIYRFTLALLISALLMVFILFGFCLVNPRGSFARESFV